MAEDEYNIQKYVENNNASMDVIPFNDIDGLVLSQVSRIDFSNCGIDINSGNSKTIQELGELISTSNIEWQHPNDKKLFETLVKNSRYNNIEISNFVRNPVKNGVEGFESVGYDQRYEQFEAVTLTYKQDGKMVNYISYAPTDNTNDGWAENFLMLTGKTTQAQQDSTTYMNIVGKQLEGEIVGGGHSKGANDFEYAYLFCDDDVRSKISAGYLYDGPGLMKSIIERSGYYDDFIDIVKEHSYYPKNSFIGQLLYENKYGTFIDSVEGFAKDHDAYSWIISENSFVPEAQTDLSKQVDIISDALVNNLSPESREMLFVLASDIFYFSGGEGLSGLNNYGNLLKKLPNLSKGISLSGVINIITTLLPILIHSFDEYINADFESFDQKNKPFNKKVIKEDYLKTDAYRLKNSSDNLQSLINQLISNVDEIYNNVNSLNGMWTGNANNAFTKSFSLEYSDIKEYLKKLNDFAVRIYDEGVAYERCEQIALQMAESI